MTGNTQGTPPRPGDTAYIIPVVGGDFLLRSIAAECRTLIPNSHESSGINALSAREHGPIRMYYILAKFGFFPMAKLYLVCEAGASLAESLAP